MTRPRIVDPGATLALCRRTARRHFLRAHRKAANAINACSVVGHPGLEPGANGLRTQRPTTHKALLLSDPDTRTRPIPVTKGHGSPYSGHRDRLDRDAILRAIARARAAKIFTDDQAATLLQLIDIVDSP
jgi:hypothetical protein